MCSRKGTNGVSTNVSLQHLCFLTGAFWVPICQQSVNFACLVSQSLKRHYSCSGPIRVDPICPQPRAACALLLLLLLITTTTTTTTPTTATKVPPRLPLGELAAACERAGLSCYTKMLY